MGAKKIQEGPRMHILFKIDYLKCHERRNMSTLENTQSPGGMREEWSAELRAEEDDGFRFIS